ncbi:MAG: bifunctional aspartate kinase/homoserine dehydrogenase I [Bacteroidales bacterium]|jgi:aspartokinase/homoserine dehydrogenase 1|nr:bifunctional aspartate kinase/homoserine dehydrogenase I [Bacteroidales bacterium]
MKVLKFGGSSMCDARSVGLVRQIIEAQGAPCIVVVSAFEGMTHRLLALAQQAVQRDEQYKSDIRSIAKLHFDVVNTLVTGSRRTTVLAEVQRLLGEYEDLLYGLYLLQDLTPKTNARILSVGVRLSAFVLSHIVAGARYCDTSEIIRTGAGYLNATIDFEESNRRIAEKFAGLDHIAILPGYMAGNRNGSITNLGQRGADYAAAVIAAATGASELTLWMNVDGFMTADPEIIPKAQPIETLTYAEAIELSHFGATVIFSPTIRPVYERNIPINIRNTYNPDAKGTLISNTAEAENDRLLIKGISSIEKISLISVQGTGLIGLTNVTARFFKVLSDHKINIIMVTQASSEYSITIAVLPEEAKTATEALNREFYPNSDVAGEIKMQVETDLSVVAIVGERMRNTPGISATLFRSLARNGVSVITTAQGSSELNISVVIRHSNLRKALNAIHEGFFLSNYKELHLFLVGVGNVGKSLLEQIQRQREILMNDLRLKINLVGVANSRRMYIAPEGIEPANSFQVLEKKGKAYDMRRFIERIFELNMRNSVFIDCTGNEEVAAAYGTLFEHYISVVTANKIACSSGYSLYKSLKESSKEHGVRFMFETNVGAGLPVINTINDLIRSGDRILKIEAVLSGTLNFIFNVLDEHIPISQAIRLAKEKGFSEPDPRLDLSGADVVRKLTILARESGYPIEREDVAILPFLPDDCFEGSQEEFWKKIEALDAEFETKRRELARQDKKWRFIAVLDNGKPSVGLQSVDSKHPSYELEGSNNIIMLTTARYFEQPMIIKGYGAGAEVTAAGVFADVIRVANV